MPDTAFLLSCRVETDEYFATGERSGPLDDLPTAPHATMTHAVPPEHDEKELLRAGDRAAWEAFYTRMYASMLAFAGRRLDTRDDAKDAVAETMSRLVQTIIRAAASDATLEAWTFGILRHVIIDHQRRIYRLRDRRQHREPDAPEPWEPLLRSEEHRHMRQSFEKLRPKERELLELRVVAGLNSEECAEILDMKPGAIRMAQSRALERLRAIHAEGKFFMNDRDEQELLDELRLALSASALAPDADAMAALHGAIDHALIDEKNVTSIDATRGLAQRHRVSVGLHQLRHPAAAIVGVAVLSLGGVAAAGVVTNTLPGPTRAIAYRIGLPVTSPALYQTDQAVSALEHALATRRVVTAHKTAVALRHDMSALSTNDLAQVDNAATVLLKKAGVTPPPTTIPPDAKPRRHHRHKASAISTTTIPSQTTIPTTRTHRGQNDGSTPPSTLSTGAPQRLGHEGTGDQHTPTTISSAPPSTTSAPVSTSTTSPEGSTTTEPHQNSTTTTVTTTTSTTTTTVPPTTTVAASSTTTVPHDG